MFYNTENFRERINNIFIGFYYKLYLKDHSMQNINISSHENKEKFIEIKLNNFLNAFRFQ